MRIALLNVVNKEKKGAINKDLAGGMGTVSDFGSSFLLRLLTFVKRKSIRLPIISFAFLQAIFKSQGHEVVYLEGDSVGCDFDLVLIYGSIVDFHFENKIASMIKAKFPNVKVGFFGSFPTVSPESFRGADFVILGEAESFFLYQFKGLDGLKGVLKVEKPLVLDDLPTPDFDNFPINSYSYFPAIKEKPFLVLQASKGCPYTCFYYCPYGMVQGQNYRIRSAGKLIQDVKHLVAKYKIKGIQFRDPTFGISKEQVKQFCDGLLKNDIKIKFGIETRLDLLDREILDAMKKSGLANINVGIETIDADIARMNKRKLIQVRHQEEILAYCKKIGIKVSAFYIFGLQGDTEETIKNSIQYALKLNTNVAQFTISCPYPGTKFFEELKVKNLITETDYEKFDGYNSVYKHDNLSSEKLKNLREYAFRKYYFRLKYLLNLIK